LGEEEIEEEVKAPAKPVKVMISHVLLQTVFFF